MLSCAGNPYLKTKALDGLAKSGIRFSEAYVTNPVCVPSRISLATGRMAGRLGVFYNGDKAKLSKKDVSNSLGMLVKSAGYDTFYGGKVHLPKELSPTKAGYDEYIKDDRDELPGACIKFMTKKRNNPFFAVASFINPHDICFAYNAKTNQSKGKQQLAVAKLFEKARVLSEKDLPPLPDNFGIPQQEPDAVDSSLKTKAITPAKTHTSKLHRTRLEKLSLDVLPFNRKGRCSNRDTPRCLKRIRTRRQHLGDLYQRSW